MRMFFDAIVYMLKSMPVFLLASALPAMLVSLAGNPFEPIIFMHYYPDTIISSTDAMFSHLFKINGWYFLLLATLANTVGISLLFGVMERHLKSGRYGLTHPLKRINDSMIAVIPLMLLFYIILVIIYFACGGSLSLLHYLLSGFGEIPTSLNVFISSLAIVLFYCLAVGFLSLTIFIIPSYLIMGYPLIDSLSFAFRIHSGRAGRLFFAWLIIMAIVYIITMLCVLLHIPSFVYSTIGMSICMMFYCSLSMTAFFKITDLERRDNNYN